MRSSSIQFAFLLLLLTTSVGTADAQVFRWETMVDDPGAIVVGGGRFEGKQLAWNYHDRLYITGERGKRGAGIAAVSIEGERLWSQVVTNIDSVINPGIGDSREIYLAPMFPNYDSATRTVSFYGHQLVDVLSDYGPLYIVRFSEDGEPLDTVGGIRDRLPSASYSEQWLVDRDGYYVRTSDYPFSFNPDGNSLYLSKFPPGLRVDEDSGYFYRHFYPGEQWTDPQYHLPCGIVEARNGDIVIWGVGGTVDRLPANVYRPFFFRMTSSGDSLATSNPASLYDGFGMCQKISETSDGGFVGTYVSVAEYSDKGQPTQYDAVVVRMDSIGNPLWETPFGKKNRGHILYQSRGLPDGTVIAGGITYYFDPNSPGVLLPNSTQNYLVRLSQEGAVVWEHEWGEENVDNSIRDVLVLPDQDVIVVGHQGNKLYVARIGTGISSVEEETTVNSLDLSER